MQCEDNWSTNFGKNSCLIPSSVKCEIIELLEKVRHFPTDRFGIPTLRCKHVGTFTVANAGEDTLRTRFSEVRVRLKKPKQDRQRCICTPGPVHGARFCRRLPSPTWQDYGERRASVSFSSRSSYSAPWWDWGPSSPTTASRIWLRAWSSCRWQGRRRSGARCPETPQRPRVRRSRPAATPSRSCPTPAPTGLYFTTFTFFTTPGTATHKWTASTSTGTTSWFRTGTPKSHPATREGDTCRLRTSAPVSTPSSARTAPGTRTCWSPTWSRSDRPQQVHLERFSVDNYDFIPNRGVKTEPASFSTTHHWTAPSKVSKRPQQHRESRIHCLTYQVIEKQLIKLF